MSAIPHELKKLQLLLEDNPSSKAFAPLAEAYRRMGETEKALEVALNGVAQNPKFNSGKVALAQILIDLRQFEGAEKHLKEVLEDQFDNLLAHKLLGKLKLLQENYSESLKFYKSALLANPLDTTAQKMVSKLESLSAQDYPTSLSQKESLAEEAQSGSSPIPQKSKSSNNMSFIDALISQNKYQLAQEKIESFLKQDPLSPELLRRKNYLAELKSSKSKISRHEALSKKAQNQKKIEILTKALGLIDTELENRKKMELL